MKQSENKKANKFKLGILGCFYNCHDNLDKKLNPWFNSAHNKDFIFSFISSEFKEYSELGIKTDNKETENALRFLRQNDLIQYLKISDKPLTEVEARNIALKPLLDAKCDYIILLDGDEFYSEEDIHNILYFLNNEENQLYLWFSINFKNFIGDDKHWVDGFQPPRIYKTNLEGYNKLYSFYEDNGSLYSDTLTESTGKCLSYKIFSNKEVPKNLVWPKHLSWLSNENSKNKILYQETRWGKGNCSYKWHNGEIIQNNEYYKKIGQQPPSIHKDE